MAHEIIDTLPGSADKGHNATDYKPGTIARATDSSYWMVVGASSTDARNRWASISSGYCDVGSTSKSFLGGNIIILPSGTKITLVVE